MTQIALCLHLPLSSCCSPLLCISLSLRLAISLPVLLTFCLQPPLHSSEKWLMGVHWVGGCACVSARRACACRCRLVCQSVCTAMSLGCVIEMEMSQSATAVVCLLTLHSLHSSSSPKFTLSVCDAVFACVACVFLCLCVYLC